MQKIKSNISMKALAVLFALFFVTVGGFDVKNIFSLQQEDTLNGYFTQEFLANATVKQQQNFDEDFYDVNEIPARFDGTQLWRIYSNSSNELLSLEDKLENKFGANVWKSGPNFLDVSIDEKQLVTARTFLKKHNIAHDVLNENVQQLIDDEELEGIKATQSEPGTRKKKQTESGMNWKEYHDLSVIYAFMREIRQKFPNITRLYNIGKTAEGRDLNVLRISENPSEYKKIWIDGGIHAREWISPATVTYILYQLMVDWTNQPAYLRQKTWYFMPVMNPDGYVYSRKVFRLWRKNRSPSKRSDCKGVDLNRNFDIGWNISSTDPCRDTYRGTSANSELETKAVIRFLTERKFNLVSYLTYHSYGQLIVYPWAYKRVKVKDSAELQSVANKAVQRIKNKTGINYRALVTHEEFGILGGGSDDWCASALGTKYVYTIELRDRGAYGFLLPQNLIQPTAQEGYIVVDTVAKAIN